ncbi:MAG TPA: inositol monophosphatase family protein [Kiritimatiellia bacterium]|nr:inositol monophosphatase family protein [Kiritimatiellia bacterium]
MSAPELEALLDCARNAVQRAGAHAMANLHRRAEAVARTQHDVKLALDHECQRVIETAIHAVFPDHHILGEEGSKPGSTDGYLWIVDPLDGTVNFSHGIPYWCHSVAVQRDGETVAGAVFAPLYRELYAAHAEGPATCNGQPIQVSATATLAQSLVLTGLEKNFDQHSDSVEVARAVGMAAQKMRLLGAAALDLCQLACGRADGFYESGLYIWDVAAADLICRRAGARTKIIDLHGGANTKFRYFAANGHMYDELLTLLGRFPAWLGGA